MEHNAMQCLAELISTSDFDNVKRHATEEMAKFKGDNDKTILLLSAEIATRQWMISTEPVKCVEYLIHLGADPMATDAFGDTAAHLAARRDHLRLLAMLPFDAKWKQNAKGFTPLMDAVKNGSWKCAKHLLYLLRQGRFCQQRMELLNMRSQRGQSALDIAGVNGQKELKVIIEREMRLWVVEDSVMKFKITGLSDLESKELLTLEKLICDGSPQQIRAEAARIINCDLPNGDGRTPLMLAISKGKYGLLDEGIHWTQEVRFDVTCADVRGRTCLHWAAGSDCVDAAKMLVQLGAYVNALDDVGQTPLMRAAVWSSPANTGVSEFLLSHGVNWEVKDRAGRSAIKLAEMNERVAQIELLNCLIWDNFFDAPVDSSSGCCPFLKTWDYKRVIGRGGFGDVYEVLTDRGIKCAAKIIKLPVQTGDDADQVKHMINKAVDSEKNLRQLSHHNIVRFLYITHVQNSTVVLFMELLHGKSLENFVDGKSLEEKIIGAFAAEICGALNYLHSREPPVIHRNINCSNIMVLNGSNRIKLIAFGLSVKLLDEDNYVDDEFIPKGTMNFMAPELFGSEDLDNIVYSRESDIWAFGCTVYQMATGTRPYEKFASIMAMARILDKNGAQALPDGSSRQLKNFYSCCVARDRRERMSAAELLSHEFLSPLAMSR